LRAAATRTLFAHVLMRVPEVPANVGMTRALRSERPPSRIPARTSRPVFTPARRTRVKFEVAPIDNNGGQAWGWNWAAIHEAAPRRRQCEDDGAKCICHYRRRRFPSRRTATSFADGDGVCSRLQLRFKTDLVWQARKECGSSAGLSRHSDNCDTPNHVPKSQGPNAQVDTGVEAVAMQADAISNIRAGESEDCNRAAADRATASFWRFTLYWDLGNCARIAGADLA